MSPGGPGPRCAHQMVAVANDGGQLWVIMQMLLGFSAVKRHSKYKRCICGEETIQ